MDPHDPNFNYLQDQDQQHVPYYQGQPFSLDLDNYTAASPFGQKQSQHGEQVHGQEDSPSPWSHHYAESYNTSNHPVSSAPNIEHIDPALLAISRNDSAPPQYDLPSTAHESVYLNDWQLPQQTASVGAYYPGAPLPSSFPGHQFQRAILPSDQFQEQQRLGPYYQGEFPQFPYPGEEQFPFHSEPLPIQGELFQENHFQEQTQFQPQPNRFEPNARLGNKTWPDNGDSSNDGPNSRVGTRTTSTAPPSTPSSKHRLPAERPQTVPGKPWIRTNNNTKGNSRTAKTNALDKLKYAKTTPHPMGQNSWTGPLTKCQFDYSETGELVQECFTVEELCDFLYNHPLRTPPLGKDAPGQLILWVQKMPADSARRVECQHGNRCRFKDCPCNVYKQRTISTGHYRVSVDEQWTTHGVLRNPMHVALNVHLYCLERFMDFGDICRNFKVRADERQLTLEPHGIWSAALGREETQEAYAVDSLVKYMRGQESEWQWPDYPAHQWHTGAPKRQEATLAYKLCEAKMRSTGKSKLEMMKARGCNPKQYFVNMGDLQMNVDQQQLEAKVKRENRGLKPAQGRKANKSKRKASIEDLESELSDDNDDEEEDDPDEDYTPRVTARPRKATGATRASSRVTKQTKPSKRGFQNLAEVDWSKYQPGAVVFGDGGL